MDNTPVAEAEQLDGTVRHSIMSGFLFASAMKDMYGSISRAASSCALARSGKHRFAGYPRNRSRCRSCGTPLFRGEA